MDRPPADPVQLYLTQMSQTPLLNRRDEFEAAQRIEHARNKLRRAMLASDYVLQAAVCLLDKVAQGRIRLDIVCEGSLNNEALKQRLMALVKPNLHTLHNLLRLNRMDFETAVSKRQLPQHRRQVRRRLLLRRAKAVRMVEETPVRRQRLQTVLERLQEISRRMDASLRELAHPTFAGDSVRKTEVRKELRRLMRVAQDTPDRLRRRLVRIAELQHIHNTAPPGTFHRQPAAGRGDRQTVPQPRHQFPRPDPRGKYGLVEGGGQIRVRPRIQILDLCHMVDSPGHQPFDRRPQPHDPHPGPHAHHGGQGAGRRAAIDATSQRPSHAGRDRPGRGTARGRRRPRVEGQQPDVFARPAPRQRRRKLSRRIASRPTPP